MHFILIYSDLSPFFIFFIQNSGRIDRVGVVVITVWHHGGDTLLAYCYHEFQYGMLPPYLDGLRQHFYALPIKKRTADAHIIVRGT